MSDPVSRLNAALEGRYHIQRELGEGGMALVYLAEDLRHERLVALKVLKPELAKVVGAERFLAEIKTTANLQHPHILPLFDSGEADGFLFYVMPYVEGETLREKLNREGELPIHQTVRILRDLVDGLAYAHAHGIVHRDIKPGNIMVSGRHATVTDFGVAKAVGESAGRDGLTTAGVALGTPVYMAPEQAAADPHIDHRADIYAAGVVAYELLCGMRPFRGRSPREILAAHVTQEPEPLRLKRPSVPERLEEAVMRCLEKRAADRWQSADDLLDVLEETLTPSMGTTPVASPATSERGPRWALHAAVAVAVAVAGWFAWSTVRGPAGSGPPFLLESTQRLTTEPGMEIHPAISPDGRFVVYARGTAARMRLYLSSVDGGRTLPLTDDSTVVELQPRWSPDSDRVLFLSDERLMTVSALGGSARPLVPGDDVGMAAWSPDGREVAFIQGGMLRILDVESGAVENVARTGILGSCSWSPAGRVLACVLGNYNYNIPGMTFGNLAPSALVSVDLEHGTVTELLPPGAMNQSPVWAPGGRTLLFVSDRQGSRDVYAQELDGEFRPTAEPIRITTGGNIHSVSVTADGGRIAYSVYTSEANVWTLAVPEEGPVGLGEARQLTFGAQIIESMRVSPDGRWLLYDSDVAGSPDVWRIPLGGGAPEQLTSDPGSEFSPDLSPDGASIAYHAYVEGSREVFVRDLDTGTRVQLTDDPTAEESSPRWTPDGRGLIYWDNSGGPDTRMYRVERDAGGEWSEPEFVTTGSSRVDWSADGSRVVRGWGGVIEVIDMPSGERRTVYEAPEGTELGEAHWSRDERSIFFKALDRETGRTTIRAVPAGGGEPRVLIRFDDPRRSSIRADLASDGRAVYFTLEDRQSDVWVAETTAR